MFGAFTYRPLDASITTLPLPSPPWHSEQPRDSKRYLPFASAAGSEGKSTALTSTFTTRASLRSARRFSTTAATPSTPTTLNNPYNVHFNTRFIPAYLSSDLMPMPRHPGDGTCHPGDGACHPERSEGSQRPNERDSSPAARNDTATESALLRSGLFARVLR